MLPFAGEYHVYPEHVAYGCENSTAAGLGSLSRCILTVHGVSARCVSDWAARNFRVRLLNNYNSVELELDAYGGELHEEDDDEEKTMDVNDGGASGNDEDDDVKGIEEERKNVLGGAAETV